MVIKTVRSFFTGRVAAKTLKQAHWQTLSEDTMIGGHIYPKGSRFKVFVTINYGWVTFAGDTKTEGNLIHKW